MSAPKVQYLNPKTLVNLQVSAGYHVRVMNAVEFLLKQYCPDGKGGIDLDKVHAVNNQIAERKITEEWITHYETLLIMVYEFEQVAEANGFITETPVED